MGKVDLKNVIDIDNPNIKECPFCGCKTFYIKMKYRGTGIYRYNFDGTDEDNGDMYDCLQSMYSSKFAYCEYCDRKLFKFKQ